MLDSARVLDQTLTDALAGDPGAWRSLLSDHGAAVWTLCRRLSPQPEDAYQQTWEKVHRSLPKFDPSKGSMRTWVLTVAHRTLVDQHRRRTARREEISLPEIADTGPAADVQLIRLQRSQLLERALKRLPEAQRRVVVLHHVHDQALADIAEREGVALGTIKSRLHRARERLTRFLVGKP